MKKKITKMKKEKGTLALTQIFILVIATIAFSWMIGDSVKIVSGEDEPVNPDCDVDEKECADNYVMICIATSDGINKFVLEETCNGECISSPTPHCPPPTTLPLCGSSAAGAYGTCTALGECETINYAARCAISGQVCCALQKTETDLGGDDKFGFKDLYEGAQTGLGIYGTSKGVGEVIKKGVSKVVQGSGGSTITKTYPGTMEEYMGFEAPPDTQGFWDKIFYGSTPAEGGGFTTTLMGSIIRNVVWAAVTLVVINFFAKKYASVRNLNDIMNAAYAGAGIGVIIGVIVGESAGGPVGWVAAAVTALAYGTYMFVGYQIYSQEVFTFRVGMWQPPEGGSDCTKCNSLKIAGENACSEYICHSYGLACEWINEDPQYETCVEVNQGDKAPPILTPVKEIYGNPVFPEKNNAQYDYQVSSAGAKIIYNGEGGGTGKCVPAFTPIKLAIKTNEKANCRISIEPTGGTTNEEKFNKMKDMGEGTSYTENHTLELPSAVTASQEALAAAGYKLTNGGNYIFYIRCKDIRGNINQIDYRMSFCVQMGPDTNPPEITGTRPPKDSFIAYGVDKIENFQVYTDEPADCKWDFQPKNYDYMNYNFDKCSQNINDKLSGYDFGCEGDLTGFKNGVENKYYIACVDQPELKGQGAEKESKRNKGNPYEVILKGTKQLIIQDVKINGQGNNTVISDSIENINVKLEVKTFGGAEEGKARCKYSDDLIPPRAYSLFDNNNNKEYLPTNVQNLYMPQGDYKFFLQCFDIAGNIADSMVNFSVKTDTKSPEIVRVYKEGDSIKLITAEEAECFYVNFESCTYDMEADGTLMTSTDGINHLTPWNIENDLYIKCRDKYGNEPSIDACSLIARPFDVL